MRFVVDVSMALSWTFEDEIDDTSRAALRRLNDGGAVVPQLWPFELANVLLMAERRGRVTVAESAGYRRDLAELDLTVDEAEPDVAHLIDLARQYRLTAYDAAYLELAGRERLPLATRDAELARAAKEAGVELFTA